MSPPAVVGVSNATFGVILTIAWSFVLVATLYRYATGTRSRRHVYLMVSMSCFWLAYSLLQITPLVSETVEIAVAALAIGFIIVGSGSGFRWVRQRYAD